MSRPTLLERFYARTVKFDTGCWIWVGSRGGTGGYGQIRVNGKLLGAHRVSYELFKGELTPGMEVCHSCDKKFCVNPSHLWEGTHQENIIDSFKKGRKSSSGKFIRSL